MPRKRYTGEVLNDKMDKTVVVSVTRTTQHPLYKKTIKKMKIPMRRTASTGPNRRKQI